MGVDVFEERAGISTVANLIASSALVVLLQSSLFHAFSAEKVTLVPFVVHLCV